MKDLPLLLVAGGSGVVPLMAMLRHRQNRSHQPNGFAVQHSNQRRCYLPTRIDATGQSGSVFQPGSHFTRQPPPDWTGYQRRIDRAMLTDALNQFKAQPLCFICGPTLLVEQVATPG
jgi:ferredoxin-NADP reductase